MTAEHYRYADGKPNAKLVNYNTVRTAEIKLIHQTISDSVSGTVNLSRLRTEFTYGDDDHLEQCLKFLHALDFIERPDARLVEPINEDVFPSLSFEARLLHHIKQQERPQNHLAKAQDIAFENAPRTLERDLLVTYLKRDANDINWNITKVNMWYRLYEGIGALSYIDSRGLVLSPSRRLLYDLLETFQKTENSNEFGEAVSWVENYFMRVLSDRPGTPKLHQGVADTLQTLIDEDLISVRGMADAQNEVKLPSTHSRHEEPAVKEFKVEKSLPEGRSSYHYPLEQFTEVSG